MENFIFFLLGMTVSTGLVAQQTIHDPNAVVREVGAYHSIRVSNGIHLILTQGTEAAVAVSAANKDDLDRIKTVVEDGVLKISFQFKGQQIMRGKVARKLKAYVSVKHLRNLHAASGALVEIDGEIKATEIAVNATSGAIVSGKINADAIAVGQSSGAIVNMTGFADNMKVEGSSGSMFRGYELAVNNCYAETSSGAAIEITVNKELSAKATSGGAVRYKGDAAIRSSKMNSGGRVSRKM